MHRTLAWVIATVALALVAVPAALADAPPVAAIAPAASVRAGELARFDASASIDPEGGPLTYRWSFGDGGVGDGAVVTHPFAVAGVYRVDLVVTDPTGATATASGSVEVTPGPDPAELAVITIDAGARFVSHPDVVVDLRGPPGAVSALLSDVADFAGGVAAPLGSPRAWHLPDAAPDGLRQVFARFLDAAGNPLPGFDRVAGVVLDRTPPTIAEAAATAAPVLVCAPGGRAVAGTSRRRVEVAVHADVHDALSGVRVLTARSALSPPTAVGGAPLSLPAPAGGTFDVRAADRAGNVSAWLPLQVPRAGVEVLQETSRPFTRATACPPISQGALIRSTNAWWRSIGAPGGDRAWLRPADSHLAWTVYSGQGLFPNWVHAATELNARLAHGSRAGYRAAVSEIVGMSTLDHAGRRPFRVNDYLFAVPEDGHPPPWRDAMSTGLILALIVPALPPGADAREIEAARRVAEQYLATFSVDHRRGGVVFRTGGPEAWYLEYTYRSRDRVLNGFLQSVLSLSRFARQAQRLSVRHPEWAVLGDRARERVRAGALAAYNGLAAYDLGGGAMRYQLNGGAASPKYRAYHQLLLGQLAQIPYLPAAWRARFAAYRVRWGGRGQVPYEMQPAPPLEGD